VLDHHVYYIETHLCFLSAKRVYCFCIFFFCLSCLVTINTQ